MPNSNALAMKAASAWEAPLLGMASIAKDPLRVHSIAHISKLTNAETSSLISASFINGQRDLLRSLTILGLTFRSKLDAYVASPNKSLDASGGSVFRIMTRPAMLEMKSRRRVNSTVRLL